MTPSDVLQEVMAASRLSMQETASMIDSLVQDVLGIEGLPCPDVDAYAHTPIYACMGLDADVDAYVLRLCTLKVACIAICLHACTRARVLNLRQGSLS